MCLDNIYMKINLFEIGTLYLLQISVINQSNQLKYILT